MTEQQDDGPIPLTPVAARILCALPSTGGIDMPAVAARVGKISANSLYWWLARLRRAGLVAAIRVGVRIVYRVTAAGAGHPAYRPPSAVPPAPPMLSVMDRILLDLADGPLTVHDLALHRPCPTLPQRINDLKRRLLVEHAGTAAIATRKGPRRRLLFRLTAAGAARVAELRALNASPPQRRPAKRKPPVSPTALQALADMLRRPT